MAPMRSTEQRALTSALRRDLLRIAYRSIEHGLHYACPLQANAADFPPRLSRPQSCFVSLTIKEQLRGCIGDLEAKRPLIVNVAANAYAAAFNDPRFPPLAPEEYPEIKIHLSLLLPTTPLDFNTEAELLRQLQPGRDGLIIELDGRRATFLPAVWGSLPEPLAFLRCLKHKAGIPENCGVAKAWRYAAESFSE